MATTIVASFEVSNFKLFALAAIEDYSIFTDYNFGLDQEKFNELVFAKSTTKDTSTDEPLASDDGMEIVDPFIDGLREASQRSRTEKGAPTFNTTDDCRLDFFFHIVEQTKGATTVALLEKSWKQNPLDTLKLVAHLRDITMGKGIRSQFQHCLYWLYQYHPHTLYSNLEHLATYGYWKDLLHLLVTIYFDGVVPSYLDLDDNSEEPEPISASKKRKRSRLHGMTYNNLLHKTHAIEKMATEMSRKENRETRVKYAREKFDVDLKYRAFHIKIAELFAQQLIADKEEMKNNRSKNVSLAGKWVPSLEKHFDKYLLLSTTIGIELARKLERRDIFEKHVAVGSYLSRRLLQKEFYVPLRDYLKTPEVYMSARKWDEIPYNRIPAKCMKLNKKFFKKHDRERLEEYLHKSSAKVAGASLKPLEMISQLLRHSGNEDEQIDLKIVEKQWESLVASFKKPGGLLKSAIAVCDVSGSMEGTPMYAALALTLLTMELTEKPWNTMCITFDEQPSIQTVEPASSILERVHALKDMEWGGTTNFHGVMELIVDVAKEKQLTQEQLPKLLLVFTDMEFDVAFDGVNTTNFEAAQKLFTDAGYKSAPPILFWNLRKSKSTFPVQKNQFGSILFSGYSGQQLSYLSKYSSFDELTPSIVMEDIINSKRYNRLVIFD